MLKRSAPHLIAAVSLSLFLALSLYQLHLPGLHYDEALDILPSIQLLLHKPLEPFRGAAITVGNLSFPLMIYDYLGTLNTYLIIPFFALLGIETSSLRLMPILLAALTILSTYLVADEMFDKKTAVLASLLLAVNPSFIFWSRQGVYVTSLLTLLTTSSLLAFLRWHRYKKARYLYLGCFLSGLGLFAKFSFLWFLAGITVAGLLIQGPKLVKAVRNRGRFSLTATQGLVALLFLALGSWPLILFNFQTRGTVEIIRKYLFTSYLGVNNLAFGANFAARLEQFTALLRGAQFWYLGDVLSNSLYPPLFALVTLSTIPLFRRERRWGKKSLFLMILMAVMLPLSAFTPTGLKLAHYVIFLPFPQLLLAASFTLWMCQEPKRLFLPLALLLASLLILLDLRVDLGYHQALRRTGGLNGHTAAIYDLASYLEGRGEPTVAMDWGIRNNVYFLTRGEVDPQEVFGFESQEEPDPGFAARLAPHLSDPHTLYIFHSPEETMFDRWEAFQALAQERGRAVKVEKTILDRSGRKIYILVRVEP